MSSQARIAASRRNGRKSRGPRTAAGISRASRNALRHGLDAISRYNSAYFPEIERLARTYCEDDTDPLLFEQALIIAECDTVLMCVGAERLAAIERMRDPDVVPFSCPKASLDRARTRFAQAKAAYAELVQAKANASKAASHRANTRGAKPAMQNTGTINVTRAAPTKPPHQPPASVRHDELEGMCRADPDLNRLERYAHRAASRRNRALREFIFIKSLREFQLRSERTQERDGRQDRAHAGTQ